ncbi:hypothetical protein LQ327_09415 [Actinomycetospora endophytica]|uniref:Uncharacterized protein n=1 Tax=Actinomycetospora endophytica TaxID=2291215 RepID=A0ABS8P5R9_9PSEU|nr:hypothetical protein [Actinomycetospora endophytica]MCD2193598.1 hypothetical protein [Actinomycetospora endophytica]
MPVAPTYQPAWQKKVLRREGAFVWPDPDEPEPPLVPVPDESPLPARSPHVWALRVDTVLGYGRPGYDPVCHARVFEAPPLHDDEAAPPPVVVLGGFHRAPGPALQQRGQKAAAAAQARFAPDGRRLRFALVYPGASRYHGAADAPVEVRELMFTERQRRGAWEARRRRRRAQRETRRGTTAAGLAETTVHGVTRHVLPPHPVDTDDWVFGGDHQGGALTVEVPEAHRDAVVGVAPDWGWSRPAAVWVPALLGETELSVWPAHHYTPEHVASAADAAYAAGRHDAVERHRAQESRFIDAFTDPNPGSVVVPDSVHLTPDELRSYRAGDT